jgi:hypothetical protein
MALRIITSAGGFHGVQAHLRHIAGRTPKLMKIALRAEANIELAEAKRRCPKDTHALANSGRLIGPTEVARSVAVDLQFGGPSRTKDGNSKFVNYAAAVHEGVGTNFKNGEAKFLQSTLEESAPFFGQRIAARMKRNGWGDR